MYKLRVGSTVNSIQGLGFKDGRYHYKIRDDFATNLQKTIDAGIDTVEVGICGTFNAFDLEEKLDEVLDIIIKSKVKVNSFHFPAEVHWCDLASLWEEDRMEIVKWLGKIFKWVDVVSPSAFVFHPGGLLVNAKNAEVGFDAFCRSCEELAGLTDKAVCMENMVYGHILESIDKMERLVKRVPNIGIVVDTNHFLHEGDRAEDAIKRLGSNVKTLHVSDYDFITEKHLMPGKGKNDWMKIIGALEEVGYNGVFNYEIGMNGYTFEDVKANFDELFDRYNSLKK